jgi:type II secretory pathway component GspD/PulD (secretin)
LGNLKETDKEKQMKRLPIIIAALSLPLWSAAQETSGAVVQKDMTVTLNSRGSDVRQVLYDLFSQVQRNFVAELGTYFSLYLTMNGVPFEKALDTICTTANLTYTIEDGMYRFSSIKHGPNRIPAAKASPLDPSILNKPVTIKFDQADLKVVFAELGKQVSAKIEVAPNVRSYKINAHLISTTLRVALNSITQSAKLTFTLTEYGTILVSDPDAPLRTAESASGGSVTVAAVCKACKSNLDPAWKFCAQCGADAKG